MKDRVTSARLLAGLAFGAALAFAGGAQAQGMAGAGVTPPAGAISTPPAALMPATPAPTTSTPAISVRLDRLTKVYENFEGGFAYEEHCGGGPAFAQQKPLYITNAQAAAAALARQMVAEIPGMTRQLAEENILRLSQHLQGRLAAAYQAPNACASPQAAAGQKIVTIFQDRPATEMTAFLADIEKR